MRTRCSPSMRPWTSLPLDLYVYTLAKVPSLSSSPTARKVGLATDSNSILPPCSGLPLGSRTVPESGCVFGNSGAAQPAAANQATVRARTKVWGTHRMATDLLLEVVADDAP